MYIFNSFNKIPAYVFEHMGGLILIRNEFYPKKLLSTQLLFFSILVQKVYGNDNFETSLKCVDDSDYIFNAPILLITLINQKYLHTFGWRKCTDKVQDQVQ